MSSTVLVGDALERLRELPAGSVQCCVTSPPYFGLRDYGTGEWEGGDPECDHRKSELRRGVNLAQSVHSTRGGAKKIAEVGWVPYGDVCGKCGARRVDRQIGLEGSPDEYVAALVAVFREVRRVLRDDGTLWLNIGDSYAGTWGNQGRKAERGSQRPINGGMLTPVLDGRYPAKASGTGTIPKGADYKAKDLLMIPAQLALALRADGWYLRSDVIWSKPNPMPESVTDRPTSAHEHLFLLAKSARYFYDADAIREEASYGNHARTITTNGRGHHGVDIPPGARPHTGLRESAGPEAGRNKRNVWEVATRPFAEAHFATFPPKLVEPCVLAGSSPQACEHEDGSARCTVLDPFAGSGTVGVVCEWHGRDFVGVELNPEYAEMARRRIASEGRLGRSARRPRESVAGQLGFGLDG